MHLSMNYRTIRMIVPREQWRRNRLAINIAAALVFSGFTFVMPFLPLYVKELGIHGEADIATWAGLLLTIAPLLASLLAPVWGRIGDRYGMKIMIQRCVLALMFHWGLMGFAQNVWHLFALRVALGLVGGFATLSMPLLVASTPREHMSQSANGADGFLRRWADHRRFACRLDRDPENVHGECSSHGARGDHD
jgi:MFS family permease